MRTDLEERAPRWMWEGKPVRFTTGLDLGYGSGVDDKDAIKMMINAAEAEVGWEYKIMGELMRPEPTRPVVSALKSPLAIRQVHPDVRWG